MFTKFMFVKIFLLLWLLGAFSLAYADDDLPPVTIVSSKNLQDDGRLAHASQKPILILFSMIGCSYCEYVEEEHLKPMLRNAKYRSKVIIRRVMTDGYGSMIDFDGKKISAADFAHRYGAYLTPTVVFVDHQGKKLVPSILGVRNTEFYGLDIDEGLELSLLKVRKKLASAK
jgi:thioredoxin-related protein